MSYENFCKIFEQDTDYEIFSNLKKDNALEGLKIIQKYLPSKGIEGADHDIIYSVDIDELTKAGITEEDTVYLRNLNWMNQDGYLACYV